MQVAFIWNCVFVVMLGFTTLMLTGCEPAPTIEITNVEKRWGISESSLGYEKQHQAALAWYDINKHNIKNLSSEEELIGYVVKCQDDYHFTISGVGGLKNRISGTILSKCHEIAVTHTHPEPEIGMTSDFFSESDMETAQILGVYVNQVNLCTVRYMYKSQSKYGEVIGNIC